MPRAPKNPLAALGRAAKAHLARAEQLGKSVDARIRESSKAAEDWVPNDNLREDVAAVTTILQHAGSALMKSMEANKKNLGGMTEEQLQAQFQAELIRAAQTMPEADWQKMIEARAKAAKR